MSAARPRPSVLRQLLHSESASGVTLMAAAAIALMIANSPFAAKYFALLSTKLGPYSVLHWVNDGLMAIFFLYVGLEIKREVLDGELSTWPRRALPGLGAIGGMIVPALLFLAFTRGDPVAARGWAIPAATDIAFALGVLALLGPRAPVSLKVFLTALAILDDLGAVLIIALFYTAQLHLAALGAAAAILAVLIAMNRSGVRALWPYLLMGIGLWFATHESGIHATVAGVALAMTVPLDRSPSRPESAESPLHKLEHGLANWVSFGVAPIFGFANAGVSLEGVGLGALAAPVPLGVMAGLVVGKAVGVFGMSALAIKARLAVLPAGASWMQLFGVSLLCGIGFTMSLFIGMLAYPGDDALLTQTKIGVLAGSTLAALLGAAVMAAAPRRTRVAV